MYWFFTFSFIIYSILLTYFVRDYLIQKFNEILFSTSSTTGTSSTTPSVATSDFDRSQINIIGVTGRKRSGKDTTGKRLVEEHGFVRIAFADPLKRGCMSIFGLSEEQVFGDDLKEVDDDYWGYSPRTILQTIGTELFREYLPTILDKFGKDIWLRAAEKQIIECAKQGHTNFVITDVRFPNELEFITNSGYNGLTVKMIRPSLMDMQQQDTHASETMIDDFDCNITIANDSTLEALNEHIDKLPDLIDA